MSSRSAVLNALRSIFRKDFPGRISEDRDSNRSSLYEVPSSERAVGVPVIVGRPGCLCCPPKFDENSAGYSKAWAMRTRAPFCRTSTRDDDTDLGHELIS